MDTTKVVEVWKVVRDVDYCQGRLYQSCNCLGDITKVMYTPGEVTYPTISGTPLFAFRSVKDATEWGEYIAPCRLFRCEAEYWEGVYHRYLLNKVRSASALVWFWSRPGDARRIGLSYPGPDLGDSSWVLPRGTVLCKWITLVKEMNFPYSEVDDATDH